MSSKRLRDYFALSQPRVRLNTVEQLADNSLDFRDNPDYETVT